LTQGIDIDAVNLAKETALDIAMEMKFVEVFIAFIKQGAHKAMWRKALTFWTYLQHIQHEQAIQAFHILEDRNPMIAWRKAVDTLMPSSGEGVPVETTTMGKRVMLPLVFNQLFEKGKIRKVNQFGRRAVAKAVQGEHQLTLFQRETRIAWYRIGSGSICDHDFWLWCGIE
jgi:hypothetical protein